jgi:meckelin
MIALLVWSSLCALPRPLLGSPDLCPDEHYWDEYVFACTPCSGDWNKSYRCRTKGTFLTLDNEYKIVDVVFQCPGFPMVQLYEFCLQDGDQDSLLEKSKGYFSLYKWDSNSRQCSLNFPSWSTPEYCEKMREMCVYAFLSETVSGLQSFRAYQFWANYGALVGYDRTPDRPYGKLVSSLPLTGTVYDYAVWPGGAPFVEYTSGMPFSYLIGDTSIVSEFQFAQVIQLYLARYSWDGHFGGFLPVTLDLNLCHEKNTIGQLWRNFGTNFISDCIISLHELNETLTTDFFEPFIQDGEEYGVPILRPFPVILRWHTLGLNNDRSDNQQWRAVRRFYLMNNYVMPQMEAVSLVNSIKLIINLRKNSVTQIFPPYLDLERVTVARSTLDQNPDDGIRFTKVTEVHPRFTFQVIYQNDMTKFEQWMLIFPIIMAVFALLFGVFRMMYITRVDGVPSMQMPALVNILCVLLDMIGIFFWIVSAAFCCFQTVLFKWQKALFWCLPDESYNQFNLLRSFLYVATAFEGLSCLLRVFILQTQSYFFLIDWEAPHTPGNPTSAWRRINVANEWGRLATVRSSNIVFTCIILVFILNGFNVQFLSSPIPTTELVTNGNFHFVLTYGVDSFLWIFMMMFQYLWCHLIYWRFLGNPFFNFLDLCSMSNISVLVMTSQSHGYYLHGKSVHSHADVDMKKLSQCLIDEENELVGERGLRAGKTQVFECFFGQAFYTPFEGWKQGIMLQQKWCWGKNSVRELPQDILARYDAVNKELIAFFEESAEAQTKFDIVDPEPAQSLLGAPPITGNSILNPAKDSAFKTVLLSGAEWNMMVFYALLFTVIDIATHAPAVAAFVVFIIDFLIGWVYSRIHGAFVARTTLLDSRFILS